MARTMHFPQTPFSLPDPNPKKAAYSLIAPECRPPPLQNIHISAVAIPSDIADKHASTVLDLYNDLTGLFHSPTPRPLDRPLDLYLTECLEWGWDLGMVYGVSRARWPNYTVPLKMDFEDKWRQQVLRGKNI